MPPSSRIMAHPRPLHTKRPKKRKKGKSRTVSQKPAGNRTRISRLQLGLHPSSDTNVSRKRLPAFLALTFLCRALLSPSDDSLGKQGDVLSRMSGVKADSDAGGAFWNSGRVDGFGMKYHRGSWSRWRGD